MTVELATHPKVKLRVEDFDLLAMNGGLEGLERTELLDGDIYQMSPQYLAHGTAKALFYEALLDWKRKHRPELALLSDVSVAMPPSDEPMPDVILCDKPRGIKGVPVETVHLLIEIADTSRQRGMGYKKSLYARQGVPEYWVVDIDKRKVWQFSSPGVEGYEAEIEVPFGEILRAATLAGLYVETVEMSREL